ncbi:hypothetical protein KKG90_00450 [Candidatus Bipolaricaulota bacterium]|nr:hypothetical protein [Candidatus Bipolaricaulota bacterium]
MDYSKLHGRIQLGLILTSLIGVAALGAIPDLDGTWAMLQVYPRIAVLPLVGESSQTSYVVQWVDVTQDGESLVMTDRYCFTVIEDTSILASTQIPDAFMAALRPTPRTGTLQETDGTITFEQPAYLEIRGAILENPETDALPVDPEDPRVFDQDEDDSPGMTVHVNLLGFIKAQIFVVQRVQYALSGYVVSEDRIEGSIEWSDEQVVLAATNPMLMADSTGYPDPDLSKHIFLMIRAQEDWTCEWLKENWRVLFGLDYPDQDS